MIDKTWLTYCFYYIYLILSYTNDSDPALFYLKSNLYLKVGTIKKVNYMQNLAKFITSVSPEDKAQIGEYLKLAADDIGYISRIFSDLNTKYLDLQKSDNNLLKSYQNLFSSCKTVEELPQLDKKSSAHVNHWINLIITKGCNELFEDNAIKPAILAGLGLPVINNGNLWKKSLLTAYVGLVTQELTRESADFISNINDPFLMSAISKTINDAIKKYSLIRFNDTAENKNITAPSRPSSPPPNLFKPKPTTPLSLKPEPEPTPSLPPNKHRA